MASLDEQVADFWRRVGSPPPYPRDLEAGVLWGLPLAVVKLPRLRTWSVDEWFRQRGRAHHAGGTDRRLRACLVAFRGRGVIFLDAADSSHELHFSLAHEAAHFLVDYVAPRERVLSRMGAAYEDILDGLRAPLATERLDGVLAGVTLGVHRHLMDRNDTSEERVGRAEARADRLALELLAPRNEVATLARRHRALSIDGLIALLRDHFGLPEGVARAYARTFVPSTPVVSLRSWLGGGVELSAEARNQRRKE